MANEFKERLKRMIEGYAVPNPYMYRENWEPVYNYGANMESVGNSLMNYLPKFNNKYLQQFLNNRYFMNELSNNPRYLGQ